MNESRIILRRLGRRNPSRLLKRLHFFLWATGCLSLALLPAAAAPTGLRVGIYCGNGAESDKILAVFRAVAAAGHQPLGIITADIEQGRLTQANFHVFLIPSGEGGILGGSGHYMDPSALGSATVQTAIYNYVNGGGGLVGIEAGAFYACPNGAALNVFRAFYAWPMWLPGKGYYTIIDPGFGPGPFEAWFSYGGGYFYNLAPDVTVIARNSALDPVIAANRLGLGRVALSAVCLELRGDSEEDWTIWDNWNMGGVHQNSLVNWQLLGRLINWAYNGDSSLPPIVSSSAKGLPVAVVATHDDNGGAWAGLIPALGRAIEFSGHHPLAIRFEDIRLGRLNTSSCKVVVFPGGYAYGYQLGLTGYEQKIRDFISHGGGYLGICAGAFYASAQLDWEGTNYAYPLAIFQGKSIGPINDIAPWPQYTLTPVVVNDAVLGNLGTLQQMYFGGGYQTIPTAAQQGSLVYQVASFAYSGSASGKSDAVRYLYGKGHVLLVTTHPESRAGSNEDWLFWDNYAYNSAAAATNPANPWLFMQAAFNQWLTKEEIPSLPNLIIHWLGNNRLWITWPTNNAGFTLESSSRVGPQASWNGVPTTPAMVGTNWAVTNTLSGPSGFYRLRN